MIFEESGYYWGEYPNEYGYTSMRKFYSLCSAQRFLGEVMSA